MSKLSVIIPAYNEERAISQVVTGIYLQCSKIVEEIIVVDDGSNDNTSNAAKDAGAQVIRHFKNRGYGAALKTGIKAAKSEYILTIDADGQHKVTDISRLFEEISDADMVIGSRTNTPWKNWWRKPGKWFISKVANYILKTKIPDLNSGLRIIRRQTALKYIHLCPSGFSFSTTITMAMISRGYNIKFVPIQVDNRIGKSTVSISTGFNTIILLIRIAALFDPLRIFVPISIFLFLAGLLWGVPYLVFGNGLSIGALLSLIASMLLFSLGVICDQISQLRLERFE